MIGQLRERIPDSEEGRLVFIAVVIEVTAIVASYFIVLALADGVWDANPGRAYLLGWLMWTQPVSLWLGIRGVLISFDNSAFAYFGPALLVATFTGVGILGIGVVVDIFDCGAGSPGATGNRLESGCERVFPSMTVLLAFMGSVVAMFSIVVGSVLVGLTASKVRDFLERG